MCPILYSVPSGFVVAQIFFAPYRMYSCKTGSTVQHGACIYWLGMFTLLIHLMNNRYSLTFKQIIVCEENKV